jgi:signal transduction histidine kinase
MFQTNHQLTLVFLFGTLAFLMFAVAAVAFVLLYQNRLLKKEEEKQADLLKAVLKGQEDERRRIATEIHDGIGAELSAIKLSLHHVKKYLQNNETANENLETTKQMIDGTVTQARNISHMLMPAMLEKEGLPAALQALCAMHRKNTPVKMNFTLAGNYCAPAPYSELMLYRIAQELLHNVIKHANATLAEVKLENTPNELILTVTDNGTAVKPNNTTGIGWNNIESRCSVLNAVFTFYGAQGKGSIAVIKMPLPE